MRWDEISMGLGCLQRTLDDGIEHHWGQSTDIHNISGHPTFQARLKPWPKGHIIPYA
jgi:hypothetical protein